MIYFRMRNWFSIKATRHNPMNPSATAKKILMSSSIVTAYLTRR